MIDRSTSPVPDSAKDFEFPRVERFETSSGLEVLAVVTATTPLVTLRLLLPAGGEHSPEERPGLAALTATLLDEGTSSRSSLDLAATTESLGGFLSSGADWDSARVDIEVFDRDLELGIDILADVAKAAAFPSVEVDRLKHQTIAHLRRRNVQPATMARDVFAHALYGRSVYGWPLLGVEESIAACSRKSVVDFYRQRGRPRGSTLIAVGDVGPDRLRQLVERSFASWASAGPVSPAEKRLAPPSGTPRILLVDRPGAPQTEICVGHVGIPRVDPDWLTASVLNALLGGKFTSRLNLALRERLGLTYGVSSYFAKRRGAGPFAVVAAVDNQGVGRAVREIRTEIDRLRQQLVAREELRETVDYLVGIFPYTCETNVGIADRLRDLALYDLGLDYFARLPQALKSLSPGDLLACARRLLRPSELVVSAAGPAELLNAELAPLGAVELAEPPRL